MKPCDFEQFRALLSACLSMWGEAPSAEVIALWFRCMVEYDMPTVSAAFSAHMRDPVNGKFAPKPAHVIEQIKNARSNDGRPGPEEAWAMSIKAKDESETVVWTRECSQAWGIARPVMDLGDEVGARMAFREAYSRLVAQARERREPVAWEVSEGFDKERRMIAIAEAVESGRIAPGRHLELAWEPDALSLGIEGQQANGIPPDIRERLQDLRRIFSKTNDGPSAADLDRAKTAELKRVQQQMTEKYMARQGADDGMDA